LRRVDLNKTNRFSRILNTAKNNSTSLQIFAV